MIFNQSKLIYIICVFFISIFFSFIPLEVIKKGGFIDRENYINYLTYYSIRVDVNDFFNIYDYVTQEWLWHRIIFFLKDFFFLTPEFIFSLVSFISFFVASLIVLKKTNSLVYVFFLINPIFIDFYYSQLRLAFAFSIWGIAYLLSEKYRKLSILFSLIAIFIHTASLFFILYGFLVYFLSFSKINKFLKLIVLILCGFLTSIITGPLRYSILSFFEDRRAEYVDMSFDIIFSSFWMFLFICIILDNLYIKKINLKDFQAYSIVFLSLILLNYFIGGYSSRFIAATYPFLIISMYYLSSQLRAFCLTFYIFYSFILTYYWIV
ncbi:MAG: hypothetical protein H9L35_15575 [Acinetobacter sp.]|uniref:hypothetical protein n=1 Tax=Acinetobacter sp. TaxID=472 RepID=UPI0019C10E57|nr:hypothetical protein [Acinetobacter sp.]MBC6677578.1 hypothetical protein [Acinetobacter sp.]